MIFPRVNEMVVSLNEEQGGYRFCGTIPNNYVAKLAGFTALITSLDMSFSKQVQMSDVGFHTLSAGLTALTSLNLQGCWQMLDDTLRALASLTALTNLNLAGCQRVSNKGLRALAGLTALTDLNLGGCWQVSDDGMWALASLTALTSLNLSTSRYLE